MARPVVDLKGSGIRAAQPLRTSSPGNKFTALTNAFGYYAFQPT